MLPGVPATLAGPAWALPPAAFAVGVAFAGAAFGAALLLAGVLLMWVYWRLIGESRRYAIVTGHGYRRIQSDRH